MLCFVFQAMAKEGGPPSWRRTTLIVSYMDRVRVECIERVDHRIDDNWNEYVVVVVGCVAAVKPKTRTRTLTQTKLSFTYSKQRAL